MEASSLTSSVDGPRVVVTYKGEMSGPPQISDFRLQMSPLRLLAGVGQYSEIKPHFRPDNPLA